MIKCDTSFVYDSWASFRASSLSCFVVQNGVLAGVPFLVEFLVLTAAGVSVDAVIKNTTVSATVVKKVAVILGKQY